MDRLQAHKKDKATSVGTLRLDSTRSYSCSMYSGPASINRLNAAENSATLQKALRHCRKAAVTGYVFSLEFLVSGDKTGATLFESIFNQEHRWAPSLHIEWTRARPTLGTRSIQQCAPLITGAQSMSLATDFRPTKSRSR